MWCRYFFGVTGGAAVHLFDSIEKNPNLKAIYCNHEQGAAFAVEAYAKTTKNLVREYLLLVLAALMP